MIYLDNAATTPLLSEVKKKMISYIENDIYGNPSSIHHIGRKTKSIIEDAREIIASSINALASEIVFTASGTESINSAIIGAAMANMHIGRHIITSCIEHHAVLETCEYLHKFGWEITYLPVNEKGVININDVQNNIREDTVLVSIMYANNEVGTIQPIKEIADLLKNRDIIFHCDMVQAYGQIKIDVKNVEIDLLSTSAHKIHGPKGIGMLYVKKGLNWHSYIHGGRQERGRRAGTENVLGIIGFAEAVDNLFSQFSTKKAHIEGLKSEFIKIISDNLTVDEWIINGDSNGLPSILNVSFPKFKAESLIIQLDMAGIACSHGSACTSGSLEPSHVLKAIGKSEIIQSSALRFSFSSLNTIEEIQCAAYKLLEILNKR